MKLITAALAVSLLGCAENDGAGGGFLYGMRPAKPSLDDPKGPVVDMSPAIKYILDHRLAPVRGPTSAAEETDVSAETISVPFPIDGLCRVCDLVVLRDPRVPGELDLIDDLGFVWCRIWVDDNGRFVSADCR